MAQAQQSAHWFQIEADLQLCRLVGCGTTSGAPPWRFLFPRHVAGDGGGHLVNAMVRSGLLLQRLGWMVCLPGQDPNRQSFKIYSVGGTTDLVALGQLALVQIKTMGERL